MLLFYKNYEDKEKAIDSSPNSDYYFYILFFIGDFMEIKDIIGLIEEQIKEQDAIYHTAAVKFGLSDSAMCVLYILADNETVYTQQDICRISRFAKQTVNSAISALAKNNYITLESIPGAKKSKGITLTDKGREFTKKTVIPLMKAEEKAYGTVAKSELLTYLDVITKINVALKQETDIIETI